MSKTKIPQRIQSALWASAAGCCQYRGCNAVLVGDLIAGKPDGLFGYNAHVIADREKGPRGDAKRSPELAANLTNLMLLCARHHKQVDVEHPDDHPEALLLAMKAEHEARIALVRSIDTDRASHVLRFAANIGENQALVSTRAIFADMLPDHYPASAQTLDLEMINCAFGDHEPEYWRIQVENLRRLYETLIARRIERQEIRHLSVFALAPQPLLIELGRLLSDIAPATVHQRHREPPSWRCADDSAPVAYRLHEPAQHLEGPIALKLGVSATINDDRIASVLGSEAAIWSLTAASPGNDVVRRHEDQSTYRRLLRGLFDTIKTRHGEDREIHVFPALPASLAVETGRIWMPKAHLPMKIYDQQPGRGFVEATTIAR